MRRSATPLIALFALFATSFAACDRVVDLTPADATPLPDAADGDAPHAPHDAGPDGDTLVHPPDASMSDAVSGD